MRFSQQSMRMMLAGLLLTSAFVVAKDKDPVAQAVDSGSFGVFIGGRRVATETFSVRQAGNVNTVSSQLKEDAGVSSQSFEMQVAPNGALVRYEWHELAPGKSTLLVAPKDEFLLETITEKPGDKPSEQPFLMPSTSPILDNNFFILREVLAWRYLASPSCITEANQLKCASGEYGVIVPQGRISAHVTMQSAGLEKIVIRGAEEQLLHINLKGEDGDWALWLNPADHYKLVRVTKAGDPVEILRD